MNFLAHAFLAGADPADRLGGMLGDFVKGPLPAGLPAAVAAGVALHRRIDSFADAHPAFRRSRARASPARRRYAGIMVDMFYDHFLALLWSEYGSQPLAEFARDTYALMQTHEALMPPRLRALFPYMRREDWLTAYADERAIGAALDRMAEKRLTRPNRLAGAGAELRAAYAAYQVDFRDFMPEAMAFAAAWRAARS